jgi:hypothetical protein
MPAPPDVTRLFRLGKGMVKANSDQNRSRFPEVKSSSSPQKRLRWIGYLSTVLRANRAATLAAAEKD